MPGICKKSFIFSKKQLSLLPILIINERKGTKHLPNRLSYSAPSVEDARFRFRLSIQTPSLLLTLPPTVLNFSSFPTHLFPSTPLTPHFFPPFPSLTMISIQTFPSALCKYTLLTVSNPNRL